MHGGATPSARAAAERRRAQAEATKLLELIWSPDAAPVTDPVSALQRLAGQLQHAVDVLGAHVDADALALEGPTALAWTKVLRELRMALVEMERLGISRREIELAEGQAQIVVVAFRAAMDMAGAELVPAVRAVIVEAFLAKLGPSAQQPVVVRGEVG